MPTLGKTIFELSRIFRLLNEHYYDSKLEAPLIAVQTQGKQSAYGWCTSRKVWRDKTDEKSAYYEITITAEYLDRSNADIVETLLHEMVHLYCAQNNIKDTSRGGTYHNAKFKENAELHGLTVASPDSKHGHTWTALTADALAHVETLKINRQAFRIARQASGKSSSGKDRQSMRKYTCPVCGVIARATKDVNIWCGDCNRRLLKSIS